MLPFVLFVVWLSIKQGTLLPFAAMEGVINVLVGYFFVLPLTPVGVVVLAWAGLLAALSPPPIRMDES